MFSLGGVLLCFGSHDIRIALGQRGAMIPDEERTLISLFCNKTDIYPPLLMGVSYFLIVHTTRFRNKQVKYS